MMISKTKQNVQLATTLEVPSVPLGFLKARVFLGGEVGNKDKVGQPLDLSLPFLYLCRFGLEPISILNHSNPFT